MAIATLGEMQCQAEYDKLFCLCLIWPNLMASISPWCKFKIWHEGEFKQFNLPCSRESWSPLHTSGNWFRAFSTCLDNIGHIYSVGQEQNWTKDTTLRNTTCKFVTDNIFNILPLAVSLLVSYRGQKRWARIERTVPHYINFAKLHTTLKFNMFK